MKKVASQNIGISQDVKMTRLFFASAKGFFSAQTKATENKAKEISNQKAA